MNEFKQSGWGALHKLICMYVCEEFRKAGCDSVLRSSKLSNDKMKKKLLLLDFKVLEKIALDFSITGKTKEGIALALATYCRAYNLNYEDLKARYNLP